MIIFGWGFQTIKNYGPVFKKLCQHCNNEEYWNLSRIITWFTLFFIPVIPYRRKYFLCCPICQFGHDLKSEHIDECVKIAETNQLLLDGKITEGEYNYRLGHTQALPVVENHNIDVGTIPAEVQGEINFCGECGGKVTKEIKFCGNCGVKIPHN